VVGGYGTVDLAHIGLVKRAYPRGVFVRADDDGERSAVGRTRFAEFCDGIFLVKHEEDARLLITRCGGDMTRLQDSGQLVCLDRTFFVGAYRKPAFGEIQKCFVHNLPPPYL